MAAFIPYTLPFRSPFLFLSDASMNQGDSHAYVFNMQNLISLIKKQAEKNAAASYFNVDILKYQVAKGIHLL